MNIVLPPGPSSALHSTFALATDYVGAFKRWHARYGDAFTIRDLLGNTTVAIADPELVRELLSTSDRELFGLGAPESMDVLVGSHSPLLSRGQPHRRARKRLQAPICRHASMAWGPVIAELTTRAFDRVDVDRPFVALERARVAILDVVIRVVFGATGESAQALVDAVLAMMERVRPWFLFSRAFQRSTLGLSAYARFRRASARFDEQLAEHIVRTREALTGTGQSTVLGSLLGEQDEHGRPLPDQVIHDELRTILIGGHETTATSLAWALYFIHREPQLVEALREELRTGASLIEAGLGSRLLQACVDETLRLRPVAGQLFRALDRPLRLGPWSLPAGVVVSPVVTLLHMREQEWPDPDRFDPSRFFGQRPKSHVYLPFGGGSLRCIGGAFARLQLNVALATLLGKFELELDEPGEIAWVQRGLPLGPATGVRMVRRAPR